MQQVRYDGAYTFKYSPREATPSFNMDDDVSDEMKSRRIGEVLELQKSISEQINRGLVGQSFEVLVETESKKSPDEWQGRTDGNKTVIFPKSGNNRRAICQRDDTARRCRDALRHR